jgi:hypothetical protein
MRFKVRNAEIPNNLRQYFEGYGETVVSLALGLGAVTAPSIGFGAAMPTNAMMTVFQNQEAATRWLQEKRDQAEYHATRLEICEWSILLFVALSVALEIRNWIASLH